MNKNDASFWIRHPGWTIVTAITSVLILSLGIYAFTVFTSDIKGRGDTVIIKNSANNRIAAQQRFEDLFTEIKATDAKMTQAAADKKAFPGDHTYATIYAGLANHCQDAVASYDAEARKVTAELFRASDLPAQIDPTDPKTDCLEAAK